MVPSPELSTSSGLEGEILLPPPSAFSLSSSGELTQAEEEEQTSQPTWYTPERLLAFFCLILFLAWADNGIFASNGVTGCSSDCDPDTKPMGFPTVQSNFHLSKFQLGVLPAMFMVGLMLASIILTQLKNYIPPFRLIGVGMAVWVLAALGTGSSQGFWSLLLARCLVGAGEASIITLSAPFVDDVAPAESKTLWFAILSVAPPIGVALGYIFGGVAAVIGWRACFFIEAAVGVPVVLFALLAPPVRLRQAEPTFKSGEDVQSQWAKLKDSAGSLWHELAVLHRHPVFLLNTYAFSPIQACVGAFSFWGPKVGMELFSLDSDTADVALGGLTVGCALLGILGGGIALDWVGSSLRNALALQLASSAIGLLFCSLAVTVIQQTFWAFCLLFGVGLTGLFIATAPLYAVGMWSIPAAQRPAGQAMLVVTMHLLGDVPSPPLVGAVQGWVHNWHFSLLSIVLSLVISVLLYAISLAACGKAPDYRSPGELLASHEDAD